MEVPPVFPVFFTKIVNSNGFCTKLEKEKMQKFFGLEVPPDISPYNYENEKAPEIAEEEDPGLPLGNRHDWMNRFF